MDYRAGENKNKIEMIALEQVCNTFINIEQILENQNLTSGDVIKVNIWVRK